jgi:ribonuclease BN (tRNA processing enzyme)
MCDLSRDTARSSLSRRSLLGSATVAGIGAAGLALAAPGSASAAAGVDGGSHPQSGTHLVLLGTAGGPPPSVSRFGMSTALVVNGNAYLIDCGRGAVSQYVRAGLDPLRIKGIFVTHLHVDHTADYFNFAVLAGYSVFNATGSMPSIGVYGPGSAGSLPGGAGGAGWVNPADPVPGLAAQTRLCNQAFAYSSNAFIAEGIGGDPGGALDVHEIELPDVGASALGETAPVMDPFPVMSNDDVKVTAVLVPHGAVFPAFAYRFETPDGSVVFSGDTALTPNIPTLARDCDVLVHEAADIDYFRTAGWPEALVTHINEVHTDIKDIGALARQANARQVVLSHLSPTEDAQVSPARWRRGARQTAASAGYRGRITVGADLQRFTVASRGRR